MYLLDTNIISEARRQTPEAVNWLRSVDPSHVYLSVITLGEIMRGIALTQRSDPKAADHLAEWLAILRAEHADRILFITDQIALEWGRLAALRPRGDAVGLMGAKARVHDLVLVTRHVQDFDDPDILIRNPWAFKKLARTAGSRPVCAQGTDEADSCGRGFRRASKNIADHGQKRGLIGLVGDAAIGIPSRPCLFSSGSWSCENGRAFRDNRCPVGQAEP